MELKVFHWEELELKDSEWEKLHGVDADIRLQDGE